MRLQSLGFGGLGVLEFRAFDGGLGLVGFRVDGLGFRVVELNNITVNSCIGTRPKKCIDFYCICGPSYPDINMAQRAG